MYDRTGARGQGNRYAEGGYVTGQDGFMDRFNRMGQEMPYAKPDQSALQSPVGGYSQGVVGMESMGGVGMQHQQMGGMNPGMNPMNTQMSGAGMNPQMNPQMSPQMNPQINPMGSELMNEAEALRGLAGQLKLQLDDMQNLYEKNAACVQEIRGIIDAEDERIRAMLDQAETAGNTPTGAYTQTAPDIDVSLSRIREMLDERASEDRRLREEEKKAREERHAEEERRAEERSNLENARREAEVGRQDALMQTIDDIRSELSGYSVRMEALARSVDGISTGDPKLTAEVNAIGDTVNGMNEKLEERAAKTDKNTHDVGVRIYRNVQASMNDYLAKQTSTLDTAITGLNQRMEAMEDSVLHRKSAATPLTLAALVASLVNLGVLVVYILSNY